MEPAPDHGLLSRVVSGLVRHANVTLLAMLAIVIAAHYPASKLQLDQSIEAMFAANDPVRMAFEQSRRSFGGDEFVFVAYEAPDLYSNVASVNGDEEGESRKAVNPARLDEIKQFAARMEAIPGVAPESTQDLGHMLAPEGENLPRGIRIMLRMPTIAEKAMTFAEAVLVSPDRTTVGIALRLRPSEQDPIGRAETIRQIRQMAATHVPPAIVVGEPVQLADTFRYIEEDGTLLGWTSAVLLSIVIAVLFRSIRWVLLPLLVVYSSLVLTEAALVFTGLELSMVSSVLSALVTVIGIATVMHVIVHYRSLHARHFEELETKASREADLQETLIELGPPIFWTCLTTALGFLALTYSSILPVRSFGVMMAISTAAVFLTSFTMLPGGILAGHESMKVSSYLSDAATIGTLRLLIGHLKQHGWKWLVGTLVVMAIASVGLFRLQVETDFSKNFRKSSPIVKALDFFEDRMGGAGSWELLLSTPEGLTVQIEDDVRQLADRLKELKTNGGAKITKVVSITDGLDLIPKVATRLSRTSRLELLNQFQPEFVPSLYNSDEKTLRIILRSNEREDSEEKLALIDAATDLAREYDPTAKPAGTFLLLARLVESLLSDQWCSFALATVTIILAVAIAFRSIRFGLISIIPNALPIALILGGIGWFGIPVNMGTAMIASVSVGLTVDSSIHYLAGYRRARESGVCHWDAMAAVHAGTGRALVYAHVALIGGFSVLALSNFVPIIYFGVLVSAAMAIGLFGDLVILPMLLTLAEGGVAKSTAACDDATPLVNSSSAT